LEKTGADFEKVDISRCILVIAEDKGKSHTPVWKPKQHFIRNVAAEEGGLLWAARYSFKIPSTQEIAAATLGKPMVLVSKIKA